MTDARNQSHRSSCEVHETRKKPGDSPNVTITIIHQSIAPPHPVIVPSLTRICRESTSSVWTLCTDRVFRVAAGAYGRVFTACCELGSPALNGHFHLNTWLPRLSRRSSWKPNIPHAPRNPGMAPWANTRCRFSCPRSASILPAAFRLHMPCFGTGR